MKERDDLEWLAEQFEQHRSQLRTVAYPMLGSLSDSATRCRRRGCGYADRRAIPGTSSNSRRQVSDIGPIVPAKLGGVRAPESRFLLTQPVGEPFRPSRF